MVRAAAASSPHMMSLMTRPSLPFSSDRRMGLPTMEGYWNSGKFWGGEGQIECFGGLDVERQLTCAAYPTFRKPVPPSRTVRLTLVET